MDTWKDIEGYEGIYQVSKRGVLKSLDREREFEGRNQIKTYTYTRFHKGVTLAGGLDKNGYRIGVFYDHKGKRKTLKFHRIVAQSFIPNPNILPEVNHINGIKDDNRVTNLEWVTTRANVAHYLERGLKTEYGRKPVAMLDKDTLEILKTYDSIEETTKDGFNRNHVGGCCRRDYGRKTHKGYRWKFLADLERATTIESTSEDGSE